MSTLTNRPDVDLTDGAFYAGESSRATYRWIRTHEPVFRDCKGLVAVSTYRGVVEAMRNPTQFSSTGGTRPEFEPVIPTMTDMDDPEHNHRRRLVNAGFSRRRVQNLSGSIQIMCDQLIDAVSERGECDFVRDLAAPLPMAVIGDLLGVRPSDREMFLKWSDDLMSSLGSPMSQLAVIVDAFGSFSEFTRSMIQQRRTQPSDDLITVLMNAEIDGDRLSEDDIIMETLLILLGGDETTRHTLTGGTEQLLRRDGLFDRLRSEADTILLPKAVEEMLRWTSPVKNICRKVTEDTEFHGTQLSAGEKVMLLFESANFDEEQFENPEEFILDRNPNSHLAFGNGAHFCMGNQLARLELTLMTRSVLKRLPDLRLASDDPLPLRPANFVSGLEQMPVTFTPVARSDNE